MAQPPGRAGNMGTSLQRCGCFPSQTLSGGDAVGEVSTSCHHMVAEGNLLSTSLED